jgi:hypothetical protein
MLDGEVFFTLLGEKDVLPGLYVSRSQTAQGKCRNKMRRRHETCQKLATLWLKESQV